MMPAALQALIATLGHDGSRANVPAGTQVAPSGAKVFVAP